jgi:hypothetical protein
MLGDMCSMFFAYTWANMYAISGSVEYQCFKKCSMNVEYTYYYFPHNI